MGPHSGDLEIAAHIESVSVRAEADTDRLVAAMLGRCWPGGSGDRTESVAREWVKRWGATRVGPAASACRCASGRCEICN
jgi:hypothetical protein